MTDEPLMPSEPVLGDQAMPDEQVSVPAEEPVVRYSQMQLARGRDLISRLSAFRRASKFYPPEHPAVLEGVGAFMDVVNTYHDEGVDVHLAFFEGEVLLGEQLLTEESVLFDQLIRDMTGLGVGSIVIKRGADVSEVMRAALILNSDRTSIVAGGGLTAAAKAMGTPHVLIGALKAMDRKAAEVEDSQESAKASYGDAVSLLREVDRLMKLDRGLSAGKVKGVVRGLVDNVISNRQAMLQLTGLKDYDEYTFYHSANVAILSLALGSMITQDYRFLSSLGTGALLHDIGKLSVDSAIINKPGSLSPQEWASMREHPVRGAQLVSRLPGMDKSAIVMILEHHMRTDGSGYPTRYLKRPQHLASRIVAIADSYDAMTSRRSYSAARVQDQAMSLLLKSAGTTLDGGLVRLFIRMMGVYPVRSAVRLSDGRLAIVLLPADDPLRPQVRVIADETGTRVQPYDIELVDEPGVSVAGCIDPRLLNIDIDLFV